MLQQTRVPTVVPYYRRFLERFPDVRSLASAPEDEVLRYWAGLGYYSRARNLRLAALKIEREWGGRVPNDTEALLELPGIGRYTAGAIRSIAFNSPHPVVDGNIKRVISRLHGIQCRPPESFFWQQAELWLSRTSPCEFNQAAMDLGALICTPRRPACSHCPVRGFCEGRRKGIQDQIPPSRAVRKPVNVEMALLIIENAGRILVTSRKIARYIPGRYGLPGRIVGAGQSAETAARGLARSIPGIDGSLHPQKSIRHTITFRRISAGIFRADARDCRTVPRGCLWILRPEIGRYLTSALFRKALGNS